MNMKNALSHELTTFDAFELFRDTHYNHFTHPPLFGLLDKVQQGINSGKTVTLTPVLRHPGDKGRVRVRSAIAIDGEFLTYIDNSYKVIQKVSGWKRAQLATLPFGRTDGRFLSALEEAVNAIPRP